MMKTVLITERDKIRGVAQAWRNQYLYNGRWRREDNDKRVIYERLCRLNPETATADDVTKIIGNSSWTAINCNNCDECVTRAVQLGDEPDYESATAIVCGPCLKDALDKYLGDPEARVAHHQDQLVALD